MSISIDWETKVIFVPQADLTALGGAYYEHDIDAFRLELKGLEASEVGQAFPDTHRHNTSITLAGVTYARSVEIINGYSIEYESTGTPYTVTGVGANHNISDVKVVNDVSLIVGNSAGLIVVDSGGTAPSAATVAAAVWNYSSGTAFTAGTMGHLISRKLLTLARFLAFK